MTDCSMMINQGASRLDVSLAYRTQLLPDDTALCHIFMMTRTDVILKIMHRRFSMVCEFADQCSLVTKFTK